MDGDRGQCGGSGARPLPASTIRMGGGHRVGPREGAGRAQPHAENSGRGQAAWLGQAAELRGVPGARGGARGVPEAAEGGSGRWRPGAGPALTHRGRHGGSARGRKGARAVRLRKTTLGSAQPSADGIDRFRSHPWGGSCERTVMPGGAERARGPGWGRGCAGAEPPQRGERHVGRACPAPRTARGGTPAPGASPGTE